MTFSGIAQAKDQHYKCMCNLNACLGPATKECVKIIRCKKITAAEHFDEVTHHNPLFQFNELTFCWNPNAK